MKKIFSLFCGMLLMASTAFAQEATIKNTEEVHSLKLNYPIISLEDKDVADEINRFISKKVFAYKKVFNNHNYAQGVVDYKVMYQDEDYLSIVFTYWWYFKNAAHGMYNTSGIVFNKHSGKLVNLKHFVPDLNVKSLIKKINDNELNIYNQRNEIVTLAKPFELDRVSHSYYIDKDKTVYLIYQPYELASYADGNTYIKITQKDAQKLKD